MGTTTSYAARSGTAEPAVLAGRYRLDQLLGTGATGSVWTAVDRRSGEHVAVKVLAHRDGATGPLLRFVREQTVRVEHPHVAAPTGWAADDEHALLVMDLVRGGSVQDLLEEHGAVPPEWAAVLLRQLLEALHAVHATGVVHRDVKPANLLLEPTGHGVPPLRLADFGVATVTGEVRLTQVPGPVGTDGYMPPEQRRAEPPHPSHDLYAAGVVAGQLLSGGVPGAAVPPSPLTPVLRALTAPDPAARPGSAAAALALLARTVPPTPPGLAAGRLAQHDGPGPSYPWVGDRVAARAARTAPVPAGLLAPALCLGSALALALLALAVLLP